MFSQYKADDTKLHEMERDVAKLWKEKKTQQEMKHVDAVLKLLSVFGNSQEFENLVQSGEAKEVKNMCEAIDKIVTRVRVEGEAKGKAENLQLSLEDALGRLEKRLMIMRKQKCW